MKRESGKVEQKRIYCYPIRGMGTAPGERKGGALQAPPFSAVPFDARMKKKKEGKKKNEEERGNRVTPIPTTSVVLRNFRCAPPENEEPRNRTVKERRIRRSRRASITRSDALLSTLTFSMQIGSLSKTVLRRKKRLLQEGEASSVGKAWGSRVDGRRHQRHLSRKRRAWGEKRFFYCL